MDGSVGLDLIGGFDVAVHTPIDEHKSAVSLDGAFPMILGVASGDRFTLLDCDATHTSGGLLRSSIAQQDIQVQRALRGVHLADPDEQLFDCAVLNIEYLLGWTHSTTLEATVEFNEWKWTGIQTATTKPVDDRVAEHGDYTYTLAVVYNQFRIEDKARSNARSLANREWAELTIRSRVPTTFTAFDRSAKAIMDLMTLTAHAPAGVIQETVQFTPLEVHPHIGSRIPKDVEVMGRQIHQPRPGARESARVDYLFTLDDIEFADVLPKWLDLHDQAWLACSMLFGLSYIRDGYTSSRLLTAATAAESLHRALYPDATKIAPEQFADIRETVMGAFSGSTDPAKKARQFLSDSLHNEVTYKERLLSLAGLPDQEAVARLIADLGKWAKYLKDQRNGLAHGSRERLGDGAAPMVFYTLEVSRALLGLVLLERLGLSGEIQRRAADLPYLNLVIREFNRILTA